MATGIVKRHSRRCRTENGGKTCNCSPSYEAWVSITRNGKPDKARKTFRREGDAKAWRGDAVGAASRGGLRVVRRDTRTVAEALAEFIDGMESGEVRPKRRAAYKPATIRTYRQHVERYLKDSRLGGMKVGEAQRPDVQGFADELLAQGLAPGTVSNILNPIQAFYTRAIDRGLLTFNPAERIDVPELGSRRPTRIASGAEAAKLLAALEERDRPLWATAFYAGLRRGELQALRVSDIDLGASRIRVELGWDQYEGPQEPKSATSVREVPLLAVLRDHLDEHLLDTGRSATDLVFGREAETTFAPVTIGKRARKAWEAAKLEPITLHECRHTFASLLIDAGANPKAVQEFMGHSKIQTTFDVYGHLFPGSHDEVRERMDAYLAKADESVPSPT